MKGWCYSCILGSVICALTGELFPEKLSPSLAKMLRFLAGMILIVIVFSPIIKLLNRPSLPALPFELQGDSGAATAEGILTALSQSALEEMEDKARKNGYDFSFSLEGHLGSGGELQSIVIETSDTARGEELISFIEKNYGIQTEVKKDDGKESAP